MAARLHADSHFLIGRQHQTDAKPCQDYALTETMEDDVVVALVSDGCSTGGRTDVGARLVAHTFLKGARNCSHLLGQQDGTKIAEKIVQDHEADLSQASSLLGCGDSDLLATCLYACYSPRGGFAHVMGDGVLAWKTAEGATVMHCYEWVYEDPGKSFPFYPAYSADRYQSFIARYGGDLEALVLRCERWESDGNGKAPELSGSTMLTLGEGIRGPVVELPVGLQFVAVLTDGITQVGSMDWQEAAMRLLTFKSLQGVFAKRRLGAFARGLQREGGHFHDDLSYAVIAVDYEEEQ